MPIKTITILGALTLLMCLTAATPAFAADHLEDALDSVKDAIDEVEDGPRACRKSVLGDLKETRDDLRQLIKKPDARSLKRLIKDLDSLEEDAEEDDCPRKASRALRRASKHANNAMDGLKGAKPDVKKDKGPAYACWKASDSGCKHTKNGKRAMEKPAWESFMQGLRSQKPHVFPMKDYVASAMKGGRYMTSQQLVEVLKEFKPHVFPMKDVVAICAPFLVDPQNGQGPIMALFSPHAMAAKDAGALIAAQKGDP